MNGERLLFKLLSNEWNEMKSKGRTPQNVGLPKLILWKRNLYLQDKILEIKLIKEALDKRKCEEFEIVLKHKWKLRVYKELKSGIRFE